MILSGRYILVGGEKLNMKKFFVNLLTSILFCGLIPIPAIAAAPVKGEITGPSKITDYIKGLNTYKYNAKFFDVNGSEIQGLNITYELEGNVPSVVSIGSSGTLTVLGRVNNGEEFNVVASCTNADLVIKKKVLMQDYDTYVKDEARLGIALAYADKVLKVGTDKNNGTPLLADGIDVATGDFATWKYPDEEPIETSNLANQSILMKSLDGLSNLTGIKTYKNKVNDIYEYYLNHLVSANNMLYWGGHTTFDIKTGTVSHARPDSNTHELKNQMVFFEPFFDINSNLASTIVKSTWAGHMRSFETLLFSRHASYSKSIDLSKTWENIDSFINSTEPVISTGDLPFRNTGNDLIMLACELYEKTGDQKALIWAQRLLQKYIMARDPVTNLGTGFYSELVGTKDPLTELEPIGPIGGMLIQCRSIIHFPRTVTVQKINLRKYLYKKDILPRKISI